MAVRIGFALVVWVGSALYLSGGTDFTLDFLDEGQMVYPAWRVSEGALPYRDFTHLYGPSLFFLNGALMDVFGVELGTLRSFGVVLKATAATAMALCILEAAPVVVALAATLVLVGVWGTPWAYFTTPYASFYGITCALVGVLLFLRAGPRAAAKLALAGVCFGLAASFKQTTGLLPFLSVLAILVGDRRPVPVADRRSVVGRSEPPTWLALTARTFRTASLLAALAFAAFYVSRHGSLVTSPLLGAPFCIAILFLLIQDLRAPLSSRVCVESLRRGVWLSVGAAAPPAAYAAYFSFRGGLSGLVSNTVTALPARIDASVVADSPPAAAIAWSVGLAAALALGTAWSRGRKWQAALAGVVLGVATAGVGGAAFGGMPGWGLRHGVLGFFAMFPALVVWPALKTLNSAEFSTSQAPTTFFLVAAGSLLYLHPVWDVWHALLALPMYLPFAACHLQRAYFQVPGDGSHASARIPAWASLGMLGLLVIALSGPFLAARRSVFAAAPAAHLPIERAAGIFLHRPLQPDAISLVQALGDPPYRSREVLVLSGEQLFYYLADRVSPIEKHEFLLYLVAIDAVTPEDARVLADESELIQRLEDARPLLVQNLTKGRSKRFREAFPAVADYIKARYIEVARFGDRRLLDLVYSVDDRPEPDPTRTERIGP